MHLVRPDTGHRRSVKISTPSKYPCRELESESGFLIHVSLLSGRLRLNADSAGGACSNLPSNMTRKPRKPERISRCANVTSLGRRGNTPRPGPRKAPNTEHRPRGPDRDRGSHPGGQLVALLLGDLPQISPEDQHLALVRLQQPGQVLDLNLLNIGQESVVCSHALRGGDWVWLA